MELHLFAHSLGLVAFYAFRSAFMLMAIFAAGFLFHHQYLRFVKGIPDREISISGDASAVILHGLTLAGLVLIFPILEGFNQNLGLGEHPPINAVQMFGAWLSIVAVMHHALTAKKVVLQAARSLLALSFLMAIFDVITIRAAMWPG